MPTPQLHLPVKTGRQTGKPGLPTSSNVAGSVAPIAGASMADFGRPQKWEWGCKRQMTGHRRAAPTPWLTSAHTQVRYYGLGSGGAQGMALQTLRPSLGQAGLRTDPLPKPAWSQRAGGAWETQASTSCSHPQGTGSQPIPERGHL